MSSLTTVHLSKQNVKTQINTDQYFLLSLELSLGELEKDERSSNYQRQGLLNVSRTTIPITFFLPMTTLISPVIIFISPVTTLFFPSTYDSQGQGQENSQSNQKSHLQQSVDFEITAKLQANIEGCTPC